ncbi:MAG TPA: two-component sensor histidine kinase [Chitinophagaceae bacterium]|nr:two-component sensor histidine kinase [Chitinophagaceae bacterium]
MFQKKNISTTELSVYTGLIISGLMGLTVFLLSTSLKTAGIVFLVGSVLSSYIIYQVLDRFLYRKIKLIYKFISQTKATQREEFYASEILPQKTIIQVQQDVEQWAHDRKGELERLQSNEAFRKEFLMNLAHELKTPIFSAQGYIETLLDGAINDEKQRMVFLENSSRSIDRLAALVDDLDVISKLESNRIPIDPENFVIQDLIRETFAELQQQAENKGIHLLIKKGCESAVEVSADRMKIKQVLVNLVENSIKYGKLSGESNAGVYIVDGRTVLVEITDNGIGIAEDQVARVFERFFRTDSARSRSQGGTGLGLAIVKHIVEAHGHSVTCRSTVDVGSSFGFTLDRP